MTEEIYEIPASMLQAMVGVIGQRPAFEVLDLMNAIRQTCQEQDKKRKEVLVPPKDTNEAAQR